MKKVMFVLMLTFGTLLSAISQDKSISEKMSKDDLFITAIKDIINVESLIKKANASKSANFDEIGEKIKNLSEKLSDEEYNNEFIGLLNLPKGYNIVTDFRNINKKVTTLQSEYGKYFTLENIKEAILLAGIENINENNVEQEETQRKSLCAAGCWAAASLGYAGCVGTLFGAPLCWALCAVGEVACIDACFS